MGEPWVFFIINGKALGTNIKASIANSPSLSFLKKEPLWLTNNTPLPIDIDYDTPKTLGVDRFAMACAVHEIKEKENVLLIDVGTCVTYDLLQGDTFVGGVISMGMYMRAQALHEFTGELPLIIPKDTSKVLGKSTNECMNSGVINGMLGEIKYITSRFVKDYDVEQVFMTGGDAMCFDNKLKTPTFVNPYLVLEGLNRILEYNV